MTKYANNMLAVTAAVLLTLVTFYQTVTVPAASATPVSYEIA